MEAAPHFFGPADRRRFGFVHWPSSPRGAALICPPLGYESVCAHTALRHLAEGLQGAGIACLRIEYDGTGNSIGSDRDPDRLDAWRTTILDGAAELRGFDVPSVTLIGLRFGATLAALVANQVPGLDGLVLWDPIVSGRRYARALRLMSAAAQETGTTTPLRGRAHGGIAIAGMEFAEATLVDISRAQLSLDALSVGCLIVARAEGESEVAGLVGDGGHPDIEVRTLDGTSRLLDADAELSVTPDQIIQSVTTWVADRAGAPLEPTPVPPTYNDSAVEQHQSVGLLHRATRIGATRLFAIETSPAETKPSHAIVMLNNGVAPQVGPGRAWVEFAARWAELGVVVLRLDLSGLGDSSVRKGRREQDSYPGCAADDLCEAVAHLHTLGVEHVAVLGLCSGALLGFDGALQTPAIEALVSINGRFDKPFWDRGADRRRRAAGHTPRAFAIPLGKSPLFPFLDKVPTWLWRLLDRCHLVASPTIALRRVVDRGTRVLLVFGNDERGLRELRRRASKHFDALLANPLVTLATVPSLDHSMFDLAARADVEEVVRQYLQQSFVPESAIPTDVHR
jgi:dienelactone hydrolase